MFRDPDHPKIAPLLGNRVGFWNIPDVITDGVAQEVVAESQDRPPAFRR